jgi:hypothetical protein
MAMTIGIVMAKVQCWRNQVIVKIVNRLAAGIGDVGCYNITAVGQNTTTLGTANKVTPFS